MENMALWHERDISHSSVERVIMPDSTIMVNYMLNRLNGLLSNLRIIPENMERNLMGSYGLFFSQRVLIALLETGLERQKAYEMVQAVAMRCWQDRTSFEDAVRANADIAARLDAARLDQAFDLNYYLRHEQTVFDRVFKQVTNHA
jgi:adenylosuccinate lyase